MVKSVELTFYNIGTTLYTTRFNIQQFYFLVTKYVSVFCTDLRTKSDYFPIQH